jgi:cyclopropane fatty-acyl-phospholipid synthase-like methyltransferase
MEFYKSIAEVYNKIFPLNPGQVNFTNRAFSQTGDLNLLDIGCGTGSLTLALSATFKKVVGIDLNEAMLEKARRMANEKTNLEFILLDMLEIDRHFYPQTFDGIVCYGNTLVHLSSLDQISFFFKKCQRLLTPGGKLLIQIINYDRILDKRINSLPTLENNDIQFIRDYYYNAGKHLIDFETILTIKDTNQVIINRVPLFPVRKSEIETALLDAGFSKLNFFGNFKGEALGTDSIPMVIEAS